jgi:outer membrane protein, heavy metal efflux system
MKKHLLILVLCISKLYAQQTLTLEQCENLFQKNNLLLLAEQYNISAYEAAVIQAKIWEQPYISGEFNAINPNANRYFDAGNGGQKALAIQQLIYLGGKKRKEVEFAKSNVAIAALQYEQLLRNLRFEIHQNFYQIYFNQVKAKSINTQLANLDTLIKAYAVQVKKGNVPLKDMVRLQSLTLSFKNELLSIQKDIFDQQQNLKILLNINDNVDATMVEELIKDKYTNGILLTETELQEKALQKNPEYLTSLKIVETCDLMLQWQKSLAIPDLAIGANYDQRGGAFNNQVNLTMGIALPLWNKNRGNIKMSTAQINQNTMLKDQKMLEVKAKVSTAYQNFVYQQKQYSQTALIFQDFDQVYTGILFNFQRRNISMLEFTDFMESYNQSNLFLNEIKKQLLIAGETINYLINEKAF